MMRKIASEWRTEVYIIRWPLGQAGRRIPESCAEPPAEQEPERRGDNYR